MSLEFEMVDDILTEDARDTMHDKFTADSDFIKAGVMGLVELMQKRTNHPVKAFEIIAEISQELDEMWEVYAGLGYAYSTLLEKYQEATKETE